MSWRRIRTVVRRHLSVMWRSPHRFFDVSVWPLLDVLLWGTLGTFVASVSSKSKASVAYLLAGVCMFHVLYQMQIALATGFMEESTWSRNLLNVLTTPVTEAEYLAGIGLLGLLKLCVSLLTLVVSAFVFFRFNLGGVGWGLVPVAGVLLVCGWAIGFFVIGLILRYGASAEVLAWGIQFVLMALSGVFNPVTSIPAALRPIARVLPTTHAFAALRTVVAGDPLPWHDILVGTIGAFVCAAAAAFYALRMLKVFRERGFVTRFS